jgi:membrane-bound lytic murein transglycosylase B
MVRTIPTARCIITHLAVVAALLMHVSLGACDDQEVSHAGSQMTPVAAKIEQSEPQPVSLYRGWDYLAERLRLRGVAEEDIAAIYRSPEMPPFSFVPFKLKPRESHSIYSGFHTTPHFRLGANFIRLHRLEFDRMEKNLKVPREIVAAILVVESQIGRNTGKEVVLYRLSRVSSVGDPANVRRNFDILKQQDGSVTLPAVEERAKYLETTFLPEIPALIEISKRNKINILRVRGSIAGAFGLPQFLPSAFLRYGFDGNRDGFVSLYNEVDALWSAANYLASHGYREELPLSERRAILWRYNKSDAYIDTILVVARGISGELESSRR